MSEFTDATTGPGHYTLETLDTAQGDRNRSSFVIDLRRSPRVDTRFPASLVSERGTVQGLVTNLSRTGLRFEGDRTLSELLLAGIGRQDDQGPVLVEISFGIPDAGAGTSPVIVQARTVYLIHNDADIYQCGVEFREFAAGETLLEDYLHQRRAGG